MKLKEGNFSLDFFSKLLILIFLFLQLFRWQFYPQFMDMYYHLHIAWGFIQAGGYSNWDFWEYAPVGRPHIYPPLLHFILAFFIKLKVNPILLAKIFEAFTPVIFIFVLWRFVRANFGEKLAFFTLLVFCSSFSFYSSLTNHVAATLGLILGFISFIWLFKNKIWLAASFLTLCFYTHIGISWFFALAFLIYAFLEPEKRWKGLIVLFSSVLLSLPVILNCLFNLPAIKSLGLNLGEAHLCQIKIFEYLLAVFVFTFIFKLEKKYRLFIALFFASIIYLIYPYRYFSAEGFLPVILLASLGLEKLYSKLNQARARIIFLLIAVACFMFFSPTISLERKNPQDKTDIRLIYWDSAFLNMLTAKGSTIWLAKEYNYVREIIWANSRPRDIIYMPSDNDAFGVVFAAISGRPTANALFIELKPAKPFDYLSAARIIIFAKDTSVGSISRIVNQYKLHKIGENKLFLIYKK